MSPALKRVTFFSFSLIFIHSHTAGNYFIYPDKKKLLQYWLSTLRHHTMSRLLQARRGHDSEDDSIDCDSDDSRSYFSASVEGSYAEETDSELELTNSDENSDEDSIVDESSKKVEEEVAKEESIIPKGLKWGNPF
jgi:hypothetical protein